MQQGAGRPFQRRRLRYDSTFAAEAEYAVEKGIPWEEYLARWSLRSRAIVIAVQMEKAERCTMCGTRAWEWAEDPEAYVPETHVCPGCAVQDAASAEQDNATKPKGSRIRLIPRRVAELKAAKGRKRPLSRRERSKL